MAYDNSHVWAVGEILTAANMNTYVRDNITYLYDNLVTATYPHASRHEPTGADEVNDIDISDTGTLLSAHASRHQNGGADEISVTGLSGLLGDAQTPVAHSYGYHTDVTRQIFLPAPYTGNLTWAALYDHGSIVMPDAADNVITVDLMCPIDYVSTPKIYIVWLCHSAGNMYGNASVRYAADGQDHATHLANGTVGTLTNSGVDFINIDEPPGQPSLASLAVGDKLVIRWQRTGTHASDTLNDDVYFMGIIFEYLAWD